MEGARLSDIIAPSFYEVHWDIRQGRHSRYDLYGGRGSCKSSFISIELVMGIMDDPAANAVILRKVAGTLRSSVFDQIGWAIDRLGVQHLWRCTGNPMKYYYLPTGQQIVFFGLDDPLKLKSIKARVGYFKYLWFEELAEFKGEEEIRSVEQSVIRGGADFVEFKSFNPPISQNNWANEYVDRPDPGAYRHHSTYLTVPYDWLGRRFHELAEDLKARDERHYQHEYLGIPTGTGGEVFTNLDIRPIPDNLVSTFDNIYMGIDWGWIDPFHWSKCHYAPGQKTLYIIDELHAQFMPNEVAWERLRRDKHVESWDQITADSAEPKSIGDFQTYGATCYGAWKGPRSREYSYKWLQSLRAIVIDPIRCPETAREFREAEYKRNRQDELTTAYPDTNDHSIDSVRYAMEPVWRIRGE